MPTVDFTIKVSVDLDDTNHDLIKVAGREIIADLSAGTLGHNTNVVDIEVSKVDAVVAVKVDCMPDDELSDLAQ